MIIALVCWGLPFAWHRIHPAARPEDPGTSLRKAKKKGCLAQQAMVYSNIFAYVIFEYEFYSKKILLVLNSIFKIFIL